MLQSIDVGNRDASPVTQMIWANSFLMIFLAIPSLSVMVLFRRKVGYRVIQPWMLFIIFFVLATLGSGPALLGTMSGDISPAHYLTTLAAFTVVGLGIFWRWSGWQSIRRGERWHTKSRGISYLHSALPMLSEFIVQRYLEPSICFILGLIFIRFSTPFGLWLLLSGGSLAVMESMIYDIQINNMLDQLDGIVEGEVAEENHTYFTQSRPDTAPPTIEAMSGVTVGFSPELQHMVAQRRAAVAARQAATENRGKAVATTSQVAQRDEPESQKGKVTQENL